MLAAFRDNLSDRRYWGPAFEPPVPGCMVSVYGAIRELHHKPTGEHHGGVDLRAPAGEPIRAAEAGTVKLAQKITVLGNTVGLDHGQGVETIYMHMSKLAVAPGAHVDRGDIVGYAGSTGRSTAPHLHWSVYVNGVAVNPSHWLALTPCKTSVAAGGAK
jgi:lysostaphin